MKQAKARHVRVTIQLDAAVRVYKALLCHRGDTLRPDWPEAEQDALTQALDTLGLELRIGLGDAYTPELTPEDGPLDRTKTTSRTQEIAITQFESQPPKGTRVVVSELGGEHAGKHGTVLGPWPSPAAFESHCKVRLDGDDYTKPPIGVAWKAGLRPAADAPLGVEQVFSPD
jgi:hypothetical protein